MTRQSVFDYIRANPRPSVLIVGGGVNGIGVFRELALQGVDVLLVEKSDFCSGASAASSHMVHGGLRYLENGEFRLVREALTERNRLLKNAPHYVHPLPTTVPIYNWFSGFLNAPLKFLNLRDKPGERGGVVIKIGLMLYDFFARHYKTMPSHKLNSRAESLELRPQLNPEIVCTATYYDAWMPYPERICIELIRDAEAANPQAHALNYVSLDSADGETVNLRDELTGEIMQVQPQIVVNAAGPWIDLANNAMHQSTRFIGGTKGSHIVVDHPVLHESTHGHEMFFENKDGRICLFFPLMDKVLIGTTDIHIDNPDQARCTEEEVDYMLELVSYVFPNIKLDRSHIVFRFSGVRPLPTSDASSAGQISRDHSIKITEPTGGITFPIFSLIGGKWTTFRAFSEQTADKLLERLQKPRTIDTGDLPIGGGKNYPLTDAEKSRWLTELHKQTNLPQDRLNTLFERYGTYAAALAQFIAAADDTPLRHESDYSQREIIFLIENEKVAHLDDLLLRRSLLAMLGQVNGDLLAELAAILAESLGWSAENTQAEIERAKNILQDRHGINPAALNMTTQITA